MPKTSRALELPFVALAALAAVLGGAAAACDQGPGARSGAAAGLPRWEEHSRQVFDDNIDAAAVGLSMEGPTPRADAFLRERAQTADVVARVRVNTVTVDSVGEQSTYHLGIQVGVPTLTDAKVS